MNNFPAMTEAQRVELVERLLHFRKGIQVARDANMQTEAGESDDLIAQIALAALTAEPVAVLYSSGEVLTKEECADQRVFEICCRVETPLYTAPPAPVLRVPDGWIKCSERLPTEKDGYVVLVWNGQYVTGAPCFSGKFNILKPEFITHWMPLPQPPETSNEQ